MVDEFQVGGVWLYSANEEVTSGEEQAGGDIRVGAGLLPVRGQVVESLNGGKDSGEPAQHAWVDRHLYDTNLGRAWAQKGNQFEHPHIDQKW